VRSSKARHAYRTQTRVLLSLLGICVLLAALGGYVVAVNWREDSRFSNLEARAFNAYALADANGIADYAGLPYERQLHGVYELALAHKILMSIKEPDSLSGRWLHWDRRMSRDRMEVSSRLAAQLADRTSRSLLAAGLWPVARGRDSVAAASSDGPCAAGGRVTDFYNREKIFSLIGAPADLPPLPGAAPETRVQAGLLRSWREGETFVGLLEVRDGGCWPTALFRLDIARRPPLVASAAGEVVPQVQDLRATPDLSLVVERNPPGRPSWGDRLFRVDWLVACRVRSPADPSCAGELSWVAEPVEIGWFAQRSFRPAESADFDALWDDRETSADAPEHRAQRLSAVAHDRPGLLRGAAAAEAARLRFDDPRAVRRRADDPLVLLDSAGCTVDQLRPRFDLTGWAELEQDGRAVVAYVVSATDPNEKSDFVLFNHWVRVVAVDRAGGCRAGRDATGAEFPLVEVGPLSAPAISGLAFGPPSGPLDQRLVVRYADPVGTYAAIPWSREALQATMCDILAASGERGSPVDERYSSTTYRLLKGPEDSVTKQLESGRDVCRPRPSPNPREGTPVAVGVLVPGTESHDSAAKP
jgi:hypothetical protein